MTTPRHGFTELPTGQYASPESMNEAVRGLEQGANRFCVLDILNATPGAPTDGQCWLVGSAPTGQWSTDSAANKIAFRLSSAWVYVTPKEGDLVDVGTSDLEYRYSGSAWGVAFDLRSIKGTDIASASTTNLAIATGDFVDVTGTTTITALGTAASGLERTVRFTGALTLTLNATSLILPGGANITTVAGDVARFRSLGSGNWICTDYQSSVLSGGGASEATNAEVWAGSAAGKFISPNRVFGAAAAAPLTSGATITPDGNNGFNYTLTLATNATLASPSNFKVGQSGLIKITQDGTGSRTLAYASDWKFPGGAPLLSTGPGAIDLIAYHVWAAGLITCTLTKNYSS